MTTAPTVTNFAPAKPATSHQPLCLMIYAVLLAIATMFVLTSLRSSAPDYRAVAQEDDRPLALPDR